MWMRETVLFWPERSFKSPASLRLTRNLLTASLLIRWRTLHSKYRNGF